MGRTSTIAKSYHYKTVYFPKDVEVTSVQLHGFCNVSEVAFSGMVYLRAADKKGAIHTALVIGKTKVAPLKRLSILLFAPQLGGRIVCFDEDDLLSSDE